MKNALLAIGFGLVMATSAQAAPAALPTPISPMAGAETPNGKVVVEFFKLIWAGKPQEAFDTYWGGDEATKKVYLNAMLKIAKDLPRIGQGERTIDVIASGDVVVLESINYGNGKPMIGRRIHQVKNGRIIKYEIESGSSLADLQALATSLAPK